MSIILNIETAVAGASVCLAEKGQIIGSRINPDQKDSAAWLHNAITQLMQDTGIKLQEIKSIAVSAGPGSYTGLRVGMATAKGLCYALNIPLITLNTLKVMAVAATGEEVDYLCPMIDARRMEVFTAVFDRKLKQVKASQNLVLNEDSFGEILAKNRICFFGNGSSKFQPMMHHENGSFSTYELTAELMAGLSWDCHFNDDFASLAYSEPFYGKEFHSTSK